MAQFRATIQGNRGNRINMKKTKRKFLFPQSILHYTITVRSESGDEKFTPTGRVVYKSTCDDGSVWSRCNGLVKLANGVYAYALLDFCESDSNEHYGTGIFLPGGDIAWQGDDDFFKKLGLTSEEVFPYKYKYYHCVEGDHHVGEDGWTRQ